MHARTETKKISPRQGAWGAGRLRSPDWASDKLSQSPLFLRWTALDYKVKVKDLARGAGVSLLLLRFLMWINYFFASISGLVFPILLLLKYDDVGFGVASVSPRAGGALAALLSQLPCRG